MLVTFGNSILVNDLLLKRKRLLKNLSRAVKPVVNDLLLKRKRLPIFSTLSFFKAIILLFLSKVIITSTSSLSAVFIKIFLLSLSFSIFISHISPIVSGKQSLIFLS